MSVLLSKAAFPTKVSDSQMATADGTIVLPKIS